MAQLSWAGPLGRRSLGLNMPLVIFSSSRTEVRFASAVPELHSPEPMIADFRLTSVLMQLLIGGLSSDPFEAREFSYDC